MGADVVQTTLWCSIMPLLFLNRTVVLEDRIGVYHQVQFKTSPVLTGALYYLESFLELLLEHRKIVSS